MTKKLNLVIFRTDLGIIRTNALILRTTLDRNWDRNGQKRTKTDIVGQTLTERDRNREKRTDTERNGQKRTETNRKQQIRAETDRNGHKRPSLAKFCQV